MEWGCSSCPSTALQLQADVGKIQLETVFDWEMQLLELVLLRVQAAKKQEAEGAAGQSLCLSPTNSKETAASPAPAPPVRFVAAGSAWDRSKFGQRDVQYNNILGYPGHRFKYFAFSAPYSQILTLNLHNLPSYQITEPDRVQLERTPGVEVM